MSCEYKSKLRDFLDKKMEGEEMQEMERHLESCGDCRKELDHLLDSGKAVQGEYFGIDDEVLVKRIISHNKGIRRMTIYGILGFILGLFSKFYTNDSFIVTKAIMSLPYKTAEFMLGIFFSHKILTCTYPGGMGFFPYHPGLDTIAELITPALFAAFLAIILGFLLSDKTVFQFRKLIYLIIAGIVVFSLWVGGLQIFYMHNIAEMEDLQSIEEIAGIYELPFGSYEVFSINVQDVQAYSDLLECIKSARKIDKAAYHEVDKGFMFIMDFNNGGRMTAYLDTNSGEMFVPDICSYQLEQGRVEKILNIIGRDMNE